MTRAGQFFRAIFAKITEDDRKYIKKYLPEAGEKLFYDMAIFDQAHALSVAKTIETFEYGGDRNFLIRLALLHDVGRRNVTVFDKVFCVVMDAFSRTLAKKLSEHFHSLYVYYNHPQIGAELLRQAGFADEAEIIRWHHGKVERSSEELELLRRADEMN